MFGSIQPNTHYSTNATHPNTNCGPYNNVSAPPFLSTEPSPPVTSCIIYYNGNDSASSLLQHCCGANVPIATFSDGCLQYCNVSSGSQEAAWGNCMNGTETGVYGFCTTRGKKDVSKGSRREGVVGLGIAVLLMTGMLVGLV